MKNISSETLLRGDPLSSKFWTGLLAFRMQMLDILERRITN